MRGPKIRLGSNSVLCGDADQGVRPKVAKDAAIPFEILASLAGDDAVYIRRVARDCRRRSPQRG
jgi:hypothetical protein